MEQWYGSTFLMHSVGVVWTRCFDGAKPQVFKSDGKQNSGFNSSLEAKAPVVVSGLLFGKMAISADISLHHKRRRESVAIHNKDNHTKQPMLLTHRRSSRGREFENGL